MKKLKLKILIPVTTGIFLFFLLESILRVFDYPDNSLSEDPFIGFTELYPLYELEEGKDGKKYYITSKKKEKFFNKQRFSAVKGENEFRIFSFGGSSTHGRPFNAETAFPRFIEAGLSLIDPEKDYKVINSGGISYASYRVASLMMEMLEYKPDLFIVYSGHNEFLEERTYSHLKNISDFRKKVQFYLNQLNIYRIIRKYVLITKDKMGLGVQGIKTEKGLLPPEVDVILDRKDGIDLYTHDFSSKDEIFEHFEYNLKRMADIASSAGIPIIFMTLPSNIKDFSPFKTEVSYSLSEKKKRVLENIKFESEHLFSEGTLNQAFKEVEKGLEIDPNFSSLLYLKGKILLNKGMRKEARRAFILARDTDMVPLRATTRINNIIRDVAEEEGTGFVDIERIFEKKSEDGISGNDLFIDHCHPTIDGHMIIAESLLDYMLKNGIAGGYKPYSRDKILAGYKEIVSSLPDSYFSKGIGNVGRVLNWARKYGETIKRLEEGVKKYPNDATVHHYLGVAYYEGLGDYKRAFHELTRALEIGTIWAKSQHKLAEISIREGNNDKAVSLLNVLINKGVSTTKIHFNLGLAYTNMKKFDLAEKEYWKALKIDPERAEIYNNLGNIYLQRGENSHAFEMYEKAVELNENIWNAYFSIGKHYYEMKRFEDAEKQFRNVVRLKPDHVDSRLVLADIYGRKGDFEMAEEEYKKLLELDYGSPVVHKDFGMLYAKNRMFKKGLEELKISLELLDGNEINIRIPKVVAKDLSFHFEEFTKLRAEIFNTMGNIYSMSRDFEKALEMYLNVKKISPDFPQIDYNTGITYFSMKKWVEAKDMLGAAKNKNEKNIDATYYLAIAHGNIGNIDESVKLLKEVIRLNPDYAPAYKDLGVLYLYKLKDVKSGVEYLERSLRISPDQPEAENIRKTLLSFKKQNNPL